MMLTGCFITLGVITLVSRIKVGVEQKRHDDERRRESMRAVAERWHFREWERDLRSSDTV